MKNRISSMAILATLLSACGAPQEQTGKEAVINDSNTPLHLMQPEYKTPYGVITVEEVKEDMDRILRYLESCTPTRVVNEKTGETITDYANMGPDAQLERGTFRLASYEWGVTYSAMLAAAEATGDQAYENYVINRFNFLAEVAPYFRTFCTQEFSYYLLLISYTYIIT